MKGIQNILEMLDLLLTAEGIVVSSLSDGKIDFKDAGELLKLIPVAGPAIKDVKEIWPELIDLDKEEGAQIVSHVMSKLSVENEKAKAIVLASLELLLAGEKLFLAIKK